MYLAPVPKTERILLLDVLRGFAIFGIFIMNLDSHTLYWTLNDVQRSNVMMAQYDPGVKFIQEMLVEGKFYSIFSLLFGIGFSIFLKKAETDPVVISLFARRLLVLFFIGFVHLLFWTGDIVAFYAIIGFLLIPLRKLKNKTLLIIATLCLLSPILWYALKMKWPQYFDLSQHLFMKGDQLAQNMNVLSLADFRKAMMQDDFGQFIRINLVGIYFRFGDLLFQDRAFKVLGMFLIGLVAGRMEVHRKINQYKPLLKRILIVGLVIGLPANYWLVSLHKFGAQGFNLNGLKQSVAYALGVAPLALAYAAGIALLFNGRSKNLLSIMAPAGKMALTNYLLQTAIGIILFNGLGLALDPIGPAAWTILAAAVFLLQIFISYLWLRIFNYGPVEWLWRSLTYGKMQQMMRIKNAVQ